jgi:Transglutaminase-like superfamily
MTSSRPSPGQPARLGLADAALLAEALAALAAASLAIRLLPFRRVMARASRPPPRPPGGPVDIALLRRAVEAWARRVPWRAVCFQNALALQSMLRRRGIGSAIHYGIRHDGDLEAHVWLSVGDEVVIGGSVAEGFAEVATFGPAARVRRR